MSKEVITPYMVSSWIAERAMLRAVCAPEPNTFPYYSPKQSIKINGIEVHDSCRESIRTAVRPRLEWLDAQLRSMGIDIRS